MPGGGAVPAKPHLKSSLPKKVYHTISVSTLLRKLHSLLSTQLLVSETWTISPNLLQSPSIFLFRSVEMPKSFSKVQKHIVKKKGKITALNPNSRDSRSLLRAGARDEKVSRLAAVREKANRPYLLRVKFLQDRLGEKSIDGKTPLELAEIQNLVQTYISRNDDEIETQKAERRSGRPKSSREELLVKQRDTEEKEYEAGFWLPALSDAETVVFLREWNGEWVALNGGMKFERVKKDGQRQGSIFPPKGNS